MKSNKIVFGKEDVGCYSDGAFGHTHLRERLAELCEDLGYKRVPGWLRKEGSDDLYEEDAAIELLQRHTEEGLIWWMDGGDLLLTEENEVD